MMRQDRFTEQAQEVLQGSQELVRNQRHAQWDVEHVFFALVQRKDGLAREVLNKMGVDTDALQRAIKERLDRSPRLQSDVVQIYTTPRIVQMLEAANNEATRLKDEYVGVEHLLIAIADAREGYDPEFGARPLRRLIERRVQNPLAKGVLSGDYEEGDRITVDHDGTEFTFTRHPGAARTAEPEVAEAEVASGV